MPKNLGVSQESVRVLHAELCRLISNMVLDVPDPIVCGHGPDSMQEEQMITGWWHDTETSLSRSLATGVLDVWRCCTGVTGCGAERVPVLAVAVRIVFACVAWRTHGAGWTTRRSLCSVVGRSSARGDRGDDRFAIGERQDHAMLAVKVVLQEAGRREGEGHA